MPPTPLSRRTFLALSGSLVASAVAGRASAAEPPSDGGVAAGNTRFALDLYGKLAAGTGNVFCSPFSVSTALGMTAAGARGETLAEFRKVLHLPADSTAAHAGFSDLLGKLNGVGPADKRPYELSTANALWSMKGYPWREEFLKVARLQYAAGVEEVDFRDPEAARGVINTWVEAQTKEKIKELIPKGVVSGDTRLVLTNAVYFKGLWQFAFRKALTAEQPFRLADGTTTPVPLMYHHVSLDYAEAPGVQVLDLPYKGGDLSMVVLLPEKPDGLAKLEADLSAEKLAAWAKAARPWPVQVWLPRFKVETSYALNDPLKALGLTRAFDPEAADLTGLHTTREQLFISHVLHKAFVDVAEEGTEAAAATAVVVGVVPVSAAVPQVSKVFRADRPFLFAIRHNKTGSVLFLGRVTNPKG